MMTASPIQDPIANWSAWLTETGRAMRTQRRYREAVLDFVDWFEGQNHEPFSPTHLTAIDLTGYAQHLQHTAATSTVNVHICALRSFCHWLVEQGMIDRNLAQRLKSVGTQEPLQPKALKPAQVNALLRAAQQTRHASRDYAIMQLLVQTGICGSASVPRCAWATSSLASGRAKLQSAPARATRRASYR